MSLLTLLLLGASAAPPTAEEAARVARQALIGSQLDEAQRIIDDALRRFGTRNDETIWALRVMRAEILHTRGKQLEVQNALKADLPPALRHSEPAVRRLWVLGNAAIRLGHAAEARRRLDQALELAAAYQRQMLPEIYSSMTTNARDLKEAEDYASKAVTAAHQYGKPYIEPRPLAALQYQYARAQRYSDAVPVGEKALAAAQAQKSDSFISYAAGNLGWCYAEVGDYETAAEYFSLADAAAARMGKERRVEWLIWLGNLRVQKHDWAGGEKYYLEALKIARDAQDWQLGFILANLATVALETERVDAARRYNDEALAVKHAAGDKESEFVSRIIAARIAAASGDTAKAIATLTDVSERAAERATKWEARGRLAEVFVKSNQTAKAIDQFQEAVKTVHDARAAITDYRLRLSFYNTTADIFSEYIDFLIRQQRIFRALQVTEEIRSDAIDDALDTKTAHRSIDAREIARQENATLLSYWLGPRHSYVWTITPAAVHAARLASDAAINDAVDRYRRELRNVSSSTKQGQRLFAMLIPPAARSVPHDGRVIVVAADALHRLNFETLVVPAPAHYWIEDAVITNASSIGVLAHPHTAPAGRSTMLIVGNPPPAPDFPRLPLAASEIASVSRHFANRVVLSENAATPAAYLNASPESFDFIHFVAHGIATRTRPLESAVILGRDQNNQYKLLASDIMKQKKLNARLVTISSCHGAGTRAYTGEGLVGLAWSFLHAGASNVIAALWEVNDSTTPQLMDDFYGGISGGADPAAALRNAKLKLVNGNGVYRYPRYWAPFVFYSG